MGTIINTNGLQSADIFYWFELGQYKVVTATECSGWVSG